MKCKLPRLKSAEIRMTPMIDVIFLLLVFFVCTANFNPLEEILPMDATLPGNVKAETILPDPTDLDTVRIQIFFDGIPSWQIEGNQCSSLQDVREILQTVQRLKPDIPVMIESADNVPMESVIDIYDVCRQSGLTHVQFTTSP